MHTVAWRLPQPVAREVVISEPDGAVVAGGLVVGDQSTAASYRLDPRTGKTTAFRDLPVPVHDAAGSLIRGGPVVVGGGNASEQSVVQQLGSSGNWRILGRLPTARSDLATVSVAGQLVVIGGYDGVSSPSAVLSSTNGRRFTAVTQLPVPVRYAAVAVDAGAIWVFGGEHAGRLVDVVQRVEVKTWHARVVGRLPMPVSEATAISAHGRIWVLGGRTSAGAVTSRIWSWDLSSRSPRPAGRLPYPLADAGILPTRQGAYLLGGETPQLSDRVVRVTAR